MKNTKLDLIFGPETRKYLRHTKMCDFIKIIQKRLFVFARDAKKLELKIAHAYLGFFPIRKTCQKIFGTCLSGMCILYLFLNYDFCSCKKYFIFN